MRTTQLQRVGGVLSLIGLHLRQYLASSLIAVRQLGQMSFEMQGDFFFYGGDESEVDLVAEQAGGGTHGK